MADVRELGKRAKAAKPALGRAGAAQRGRALLEIAGVLEREGELILAANRRDVAAAEKAGISPALIDRLRLTEQRVKDMADSVRQVAAMPDPVGTVLGGSCLPNGLRLEKVRVPLGVVGMIYEARPNVTVDAAALCVKSGNVCLLRGGKEALQTNLALAKGMREALGRAAPGRHPLCGRHLTGERGGADEAERIPGCAGAPGRRGAHPQGGGDGHGASD